MSWSLESTVLDLSEPSKPVRVGGILVGALGAGVNSVAVHDGLVALAIEAAPKTAPGVVALYNASDLRLLHTVPVGALPDMLVFTPDGQHLLVANEGELNSYGQADSVDPEGSVRTRRVFVRNRRPPLRGRSAMSNVTSWLGSAGGATGS